MAFDITKIPDELIENFKNGSGVIFVGAGMSMGAGFPDWKGLLEAMILEADKVSWISKSKIDEYRHLVNDSSKFLMLAEDIKTELGAGYSEFMTKTFVDYTWTPTKNHELIVRINSSLIITINYDDLIESAYNDIYKKYPVKVNFDQAKIAANNFWKGRFFILKAHGDAKSDVDSLILTQRDYRKTLYREAGYRSLLMSIFTTKSILFLGVSMNDPEFNQLIDYLHDSYHGGGPTHFLLVNERKNYQTVSKRLSEDFKIQTVTYNNDNNDFVEITEFLEHIYNEAPRV